MSASERKQILRNKLLGQRDALTPDAWRVKNSRLVANLETWLGGRHWRDLFLYAGFRNEPILTQLIEQIPADRCAALPVINFTERSMEFYLSGQGEKLHANKFGILEPEAVSTKRMLPGRETIIVVPALAVDRRGQRLGFGQGFYDRYLARFPLASTVAAIFDEFVVEQIEAESFDVPVDWIITDLDVRETTK